MSAPPQPGPVDGFAASTLGAARQALDTMAELVMMRDAQGRIIEVNTAFLHAFGGERVDWIGCWFAVSPSRAGEATPQRYDVAMRTRAGPSWIEWSETLCPDGSSVAVGRDVSRERQARAEQSEAARGKSVFFAAVTHELRTPLSGALGAAALLADTKLAPDQLAYLEAVRESAGHALGLIDDILDLTRLEAGRLELRPGPVDLRHLISQLAEVLGPRAAERGLTLTYAVDAQIPQSVTADEGRLKQILFNLAGNALKFTEEGGVLIRAEMAAGRVRLSVRDSGPGISAQDQKRLFEHFERGAAERKAAPGAGLGLAMVKRLAEAMGGEVGVQSEPGAGALFWISAPMTARDAAPEARPLAGRTLLIAAPDPLQREGLALQSEALGATSLTAATAQEAVAEAQRVAGALTVVLDADWVTEAGAIKSAAPQARILALAEPRTKDQFSAEARPDGVDGWLVAPVRSSSLAAWAVGEAQEERAGRDDPQMLNEPLAGLAVLLAEDDPVNAMIARTVLTKLGAQVTHVENGRAAVEHAAGGGFDAALLDLRMPELSGLEAAAEIRALPKAAALPLIALTANATEADRAACLAAGMDTFMTKPLDPQELAERLIALCAPQNRANVG